MGVSHITPDGSGGYWGWDDQANDWIPVDPQAQEGSFAGNVGRAAARGMGDIGLGVEELTGAATAEQIAARRQASQTQGAAAAAGAPLAELLGGTAPDVIAGLGAGALTGGAGLPAVLASSALAGAGTAAIRPGSIEERLNAAMLGAIAGAGGELFGQAAAKGVGLALQLGRGIVERGTQSTARAVETGAQRAATARAMETMPEGQTSLPGQPGAIPSQPGMGQPPIQGRSTAGAQQVVSPETQALEEEGQVMDWLQSTEEVTDAAKSRRVYEAAEQYGYQPPYWEGATRGSKAMLRAAADEFNPAKSSNEAARLTKNNALANRAYAYASGMTTDINDTRFNSIDLSDLGTMLGHLEKGFEEVEGEMAPIPFKAIQKQLAKIADREGLVAGTRGEEVLRDLKQKLSQKVMASDGGAAQDPGGFIADLRRIQAEALRASKDGDQESANILNQAVNLYYDTAERVTKQTPARRGGYRDETIVGKGWKELRDEYRMYMMATKPGGWSADGNINPRTMLNRMRGQPVNGGWGSKGPKPDSTARPLWDVLIAANKESLGSIPPTGVRLTGNIAKMAKASALPLAGLGGLTNLSRLWD